MSDMSPSTSSNINILRIPTGEVHDWWEEVEQGVRRAINNSDNLRTAAQVREALIRGDWVLWIVVEESTLLGAAITEVMETAKGLYCNIPFGYSEDPRKDIHQYFFPFIEKIARENNFRGVKFISKRPGYERKAESMGYKKGFVEYRKEFE